MQFLQEYLREHSYPPSIREICGGCGAYFKTVDVPALSPFPLLTIADLDTMDLDVAAIEHHYARPPMKEFGARH